MHRIDFTTSENKKKINAKLYGIVFISFYMIPAAAHMTAVYLSFMCGDGDSRKNKNSEKSAQTENTIQRFKETIWHDSGFLYL